MARTSLIFGGLLMALGIGGYLGSGRNDWRMLIPAGIGTLLLLAGLVALRAAWRKHAMHAAAALGLVGLLATVFGLVELISKVLDEPYLIIQAITSVLCGTFVGLCIKSFIDARRARK